MHIYVEHTKWMAGEKSDRVLRERHAEEDKDEEEKDNLEAEERGPEGRKVALLRLLWMWRGAIPDEFGDVSRLKERRKREIGKRESKETSDA